MQRVLYCNGLSYVFFFPVVQQIESLDNAYIEQKGELAALQERLDDLARERCCWYLFLLSCRLRNAVRASPLQELLFTLHTCVFI